MIKETGHFISQHVDAIKNGADSIAIAGVAAAIMNWVPPITAVFSLIYILVRLYETETMQKLLGKKKNEQGSSEEKSD